MKINLEERNGEIVPISIEIENDKEVEFLLNQLRPKGEWVSKEYRRFLPRDAEPYYNDDTYDEKTHSVIDSDIVCSECGASKHFYHNFCGNCGASMKGEQK